MPKFTNAQEGMDTHAIGGTGFHFTAASIGTLGASEYTLATAVIDGSGSVSPYWDLIKAVCEEIARTCGDPKNPRADNIMLRVLLFSDGLSEIHGFKPIRDLNPQDYQQMNLPGGSTALLDATYDAVMASANYGRDLRKQKYAVNAAVFVVTDGQDNNSKVTAKMVKDAMAEAKQQENLESIMTVLIGVGTGGQGAVLDTYLDSFQKDAGFQQYVGIATADRKTLMKLGGFISQSISSQSQSLGSGGASQSLTF